MDMDKFILKNIINHIPYAIFWKDKHSIFQGCNREFAHQFGLDDPNDIIGKTDYDLQFPADLIHLYLKDDLEVIRTGQPKLDYEEVQVQSDGSKKVLLVSKMPFLDDAGEILGVLCIYSDITQKKEEELQLKLAKEAAEAANRSKDDFIANMSHDIRTPLSGIIGLSSLIEEEATNSHLKEQAHMVNTSGEQLLALLNDVLDILSTGSAEETAIHSERMNIYALIRSICELEMPCIQVKGLEFIVDVDNTVPEWINSDAIKIHRILLNLLGNAIKFTKQGMIKIEVSTSESTEGQVFLIIKVSDTGIGIPKAARSKIFDRFYRATPSHKGLYIGHGVGLHIVQQYIEVLKGQITLESKLRKGTTFTVTIPIEVNAEDKISDDKLSKEKNTRAAVFPLMTKVNQPVEEVKDISSAVFSPSTSTPIDTLDKNAPCLLLVEDNPVSLKMAEAIAKKAACRFISAVDAESAFELLKHHKIDLILSDIGLPGMSGYELTSAIRAWEKETGGKAIPIIGLTAHGVADVEEVSKKVGMNQVITKPLRLDVLHQVLSQFF